MEAHCRITQRQQQRTYSSDRAGAEELPAVLLKADEDVGQLKG